MMLKYNRFALVPHLCNECKKYIWLEPFRRIDVFKPFYQCYMKQNICKRCLPKYIPNIEESVDRK